MSVVTGQWSSGRAPFAPDWSNVAKRQDGERFSWCSSSTQPTAFAGRCKDDEMDARRHHRAYIERKEINVGDPVLVNTKGRNSRRCGTCIRKYECDGVQFYDVAPPAPSLKSMSATRSFDKRQPCSFMTRVLFSDIEHADSLICRPGEVRFYFLVGGGE